MEVTEESVIETIKTPPPRPPQPKLFPDSIPSAAEELEKLPKVPEEEKIPVEIRRISEQNPKLYKLIQMSNDDSFDMDDADPNLNHSRRIPPNGFLSQNSSSFWWDANEDETPALDFVVDPFPSSISDTVYFNAGTNCVFQIWCPKVEENLKTAGHFTKSLYLITLKSTKKNFIFHILPPKILYGTPGPLCRFKRVRLCPSHIYANKGSFESYRGEGVS